MSLRVILGASLAGALLVAGTAAPAHANDETPSPPPATQTKEPPPPADPVPSEPVPLPGGIVLDWGQDTAGIQVDRDGEPAAPGVPYGEIVAAPGDPRPWSSYVVCTEIPGLEELGPIACHKFTGLPQESSEDFSLPGAAASAVARLSVPSPQINISPQPSDNKWNVLAVGLPLWVWATDQAPVTTSVSEQGIDISMTATRGTVRFDWGDGTSSTCELMRPRPQGMDPLTPSPDCGHTYLKKGDYVVTATAAWAVNWQALGQSGTLPLTSTNTMSIPIREFSSVVVG